jgi:DNA repair protein RadC
MHINSSFKAYELLKSHIGMLQEEVWLLCLDSELKVLGIDMLFRGTVDCCLLHPRDLIRQLCLRNASSFILAHNHPSQNPLPSREDIAVTRKINKISKLLEIQFQDHIIITSKTYFSLADKRILVSGSVLK